MREGGHGGDQRARRDGASVREHGFLAGRRGEPGLEEQLDAALAQDALREAAQLLRHLGEDPVLGVDQHDADLARVDLRIVRRHTPDEVVQLRHHFDAGEAAAGDDERQQLSPQLLVVALDRRLLQRADHVVAQVQRVVQVLERQRMLRQPAQPPEVGDGAEREDQVVVLDHVRVRQEAGRGGDRALLQIDRLDLPDVDLGPGQQAPQRADQVEQTDGPRDHFRQHRLEHEVVFLRDQHDLVIAVASELPLELLSGEDCAKSAAENDDALRTLR